MHKLSEGLHGFEQSEVDKCLSMKQDIVCVISVDGTIMVSSVVKATNMLISSLGIVDEEQRHAFERHNEGELGMFGC